MPKKAFKDCKIIRYGTFTREYMVFNIISN